LTDIITAAWGSPAATSHRHVVNAGRGKSHPRARRDRGLSAVPDRAIVPSYPKVIVGAPAISRPELLETAAPIITLCVAAGDCRVRI